MWWYDQLVQSHLRVHVCIKLLCNSLDDIHVNMNLNPLATYDCWTGPFSVQLHTYMYIYLYVHVHFPAVCVCTCNMSVSMREIKYSLQLFGLPHIHMLLRHSPLTEVFQSQFTIYVCSSSWVRWMCVLLVMPSQLSDTLHQLAPVNVLV